MNKKSIEEFVEIQPGAIYWSIIELNPSRTHDKKTGSSTKVGAGDKETRI
jgi:hypothetical protein